MPRQLELDTTNSDPLALDAFVAGLNIHSVLCLGLSPLTFRGGEAWRPLAERLAASTGYDVEFALDTGQASDEVMAENPWASRDGTLTFRKMVH